MSELIVFLMHLLVVPTVCRKLVNATSWHKRSFNRLVAMLSAFLLLVVVFTTYMTLSAQPPNFYRVLDVDVTASTLEIKRAYKTAALRLHPDKNPSPTAQEDFARLQAAMEILEREEMRRVYDRQGMPEIPGRPLSALSFEETMLRMAMTYAVMFVIAYVLCFGCESPQARTIAWIGLFFAFLLEYKLRFSPAWETVGSSWLFSRTPTFEKIMILHAAYPAFVQGCRTLTTLLHVDRQQLFFAELMMQNRALMARFDALEQAVLHGKFAARETVSKNDAASNLTGKQRAQAIERAAAAAANSLSSSSSSSTSAAPSATTGGAGANGAANIVNAPSLGNDDLFGGAGAGPGVFRLQQPFMQQPNQQHPQQPSFFEQYKGLLMVIAFQAAIWLMNH